MNEYYIQYHSRTLASLQNIKEQQSAERSIYNFIFPTTSTKIALSDGVKKVDDINLHIGLNIIVNLGASSLEEARGLSKDYAEMLLNLISFITLASCDSAELISVMDVTNKDEFPARFNIRSLSQEKLLESLVVIDDSHLGAVFQAYTNSGYLYPDRVAMALMWFRKGLLERQTIDEFLCYWFAIELISCVLRRKLRSKTRNPGQWDGIEDIFVSKVKFNDWEKIRKARQDIVHGKRRLNNQFMAELHTYVKPMMRSLVFAVGDVLGIDQETVETICSKTAKKRAFGTKIVLEGTLKDQSGDFEIITKDYPSVDVQSEGLQYSLDNKGKVQIKGSPTYTFHLATGVVFLAHGFEIWKE